MLIPFEGESLTRIPEKSGVYLLYNPEGELVYVGKAVNIRRRISSYLNKHHAQGILFPEKIASLEYLLTKDERDAFITERELIRKKQPRYNIKLRDDKNYYLLRIKGSERFPSLELVRRRSSAEDFYCGPFVSSLKALKLYRTLGRTFRLRTCRKMPQRDRGCLDHFLGLCCAPCTGKVPSEEYRVRVEGAASFLRGEGESVLRRIREEIAEAAGRLEFERAAELRDDLLVLEGFHERGCWAREVAEGSWDAWRILREGDKSLFYLWRYSGQGRLQEKREWFLHPVNIPSEELLLSVLSQFYGKGRSVENLFFSPPLKDLERETLLPFLDSLVGHPVGLLTPEQVPVPDLSTTLEENARVKWEEYLQQRTLDDLQKRLRLRALPWKIEGVDISHLAGEEIVASMVAFTGGEPDKKYYRKFFLDKKKKANDPENIYRVLRRRFSGDEKERLPDLLLVDGGKAQLRYAFLALRECGLENLPLVSLSKGEPEHLHLLDRPDPLPDDGASDFNLLKWVRDEAHRFALAYQRKRRTFEK